MTRSGEAVDTWVSEEHVIQLHDTWIDLQDQKHSLGGELLEWITDWLGDGKLVSATGAGGTWWQVANKQGTIIWSPHACR